MPLEIPVSIELTPLSAWPDEQLRRVYRLMVSAVRQHADPDDPEGPGTRADAELFGMELVRRGLL
jgi:hypothetical protein